MNYFIPVIMVGLMNIIPYNYSIDASVKPNSISESSSELGHGIDAVRGNINDSMDILTGSNIFNEDFLLEQQSNAIRIEMDNTIIDTEYSNSFESQASALTSELSFDTSISLGNLLFSIGMENNFYLDGIQYEESAINNFFYTYHYQFNNYSLALPSINEQLYLDNLTSEFEAAVNSLSSYYSYRNFFQTYGTHVVVKGIYGGKFYLNYYAYSNLYNLYDQFGGEISSELTSQIVIALDEKKTNFNFNYQNEEISSNLTESMSLKSYGGSNFESFNVNNFASKFNEWASSLENNSIFMSTSNDGLIPVWEFVPSSKKETMKNMFQRYYEDEMNSFSSIYSYDPLSKGFSFMLPVYEGEKTISDGTFLFDIVNFREFPYRLEDIKDKLQYLTVQLLFDMREIDDGYQDIAISSYVDTSSFSSNSSNTRKVMYGIEHGPGKLDSNYQSKILTYSSFLINDFYPSSNALQLFIRYSSHGNGSNAWKLKNLSANLVFSQKPIATSTQIINR